MQPPLERLSAPASRALEALRDIAAGWLGSGEDLHVEVMRATMGAALAQSLSPLLEESLAPDSWQAQAARSLVRREELLEGYLASLGGGAEFLQDLAPSFQIPPRYRATGSVGPRPYPILNYLDTVVAELAHGSLGGEELDGVLDALWESVAQANHRLASEADPLRSTRGVHGCREALAGLQNLEAFGAEGNPDLLERGMARLVEGFQALDQVYLDGALELGSLPTPCPQVNWLYHALAAYEEGFLEAATAQRAMDDLLTRVTRVYYDLEGQLSRFYGGPPDLLEEAGRLRSALDQLSLSLAAPGGPELTTLKQSGTALGLACQVLMRAAEPAGQVFCLHCGQPNSPALKLCTGCGAGLAWFSAQSLIEAQAGDRGPSTFLRQLLQGCDQLQEGLIDTGQFSGLLRSAYQRLHQARRGLDRLPPLEPYGLQALGAKAMLGAALDQLSQALDLLHEYLVEHRLSSLSKGVRQLVAAGRALEQVRDL